MSRCSTSNPPMPAFSKSDEEVISEFKKRTERAIRTEIAAKKAEEAKKHPEGLLDEI